jgi:proton glutamate symport protein
VSDARRRGPGLTTQVLIALALGALVGWLWPALGARLEILSTIFIRLVLMIIAPLVFSTLVVGVAGAPAAGRGEARRLGAMAVRSLAYFLAVTAAILALGIGLGFLFSPGAGLAPPAAAAPVSAPPAEEPFWLRFIPRNVVEAMARGDVLQIVVFSLLFAAALAAAGERSRPVLDVCRALAETMYRLTDIVMRAAPVGVLGAAAALVAAQGLKVGESYLRLTLAVWFGLALVFFGLFPLLGRWAGLPMRGFYRAVREPFAIAFATTSSAAALPPAMEVMEKFGVPRGVAAFVLPTGYSFNLDGAALYIGVAAVFTAQAFGLALAPTDWLALAATLYVASKGIATVPRGSLLAFAAGLSSFGIPAETVGAAFGLLLAIDPILDMPRTGVNVSGNCLAAALVARWQDSFESNER